MEAVVAVTAIDLLLERENVVVLTLLRSLLG